MYEVYYVRTHLSADMLYTLSNLLLAVIYRDQTYYCVVYITPYYVITLTLTNPDEPETNPCRPARRGFVVVGVAWLDHSLVG